MRGDGGATALGEWRWCNAHAFNPHDIERVASAHRARALTLSDRRTPATGLRERVSQILRLMLEVMERSTTPLLTATVVRRRQACAKGQITEARGKPRQSRSAEKRKEKKRP
jgi:hypothetical protein